MKTDRNLLVEKVYTVWGLILITWALYRAKVHLPEFLDELVFKPLVFVAPLLFYVEHFEQKGLKTIGLAKGKLKRDIVIGVICGLIFTFEGMVANSVKYGTFSFIPPNALSGFNLPFAILIALVAAFSEEVLVRGFLFTRLKEGYKSELKALVVSTMMYLILLVPLIFTTTHLTGISLLIFLVNSFIISFANTMIFTETKTLTIPILIHAFWNVAVVFYL